MQDKDILDLYFKRAESALAETDKKYGKYCRYVSYSILRSDTEAEECVNDAYVAAWRSIPPKRPERLTAYLGKLVRNISINRYLHDRREKRSGHTELVLEELSEIIPDLDTDRPLADDITLRDAINSFVSSLPKQTRIVFVRRYWYMSSIKDISKDTGITQSNVKVILMRTRHSFRVYLEKEGIRI